jgi:hypothetical protein
MGDWRPLAGRVSLFAAEPNPATSASETFRRVWGLPAEFSQPRSHPQGPAIARGRKGALGLACTAQADRVDFDLRRARADDAPRSGLDRIEDLREYGQRLDEVFLAAKDPGLVTAASRVELFTGFALACADVPAANREIMQVIRETYRPSLDAEEAFVLQVNNKFPSGRVKDIELNLLVRWSVEAPDGNVEFTTASVFFDISTGPSERGFDGGEQYLLLDELRQLTSRAQRTLNLNIDGL